MWEISIRRMKSSLGREITVPSLCLFFSFDSKYCYCKIIHNFTVTLKIIQNIVTIKLFKIVIRVFKMFTVTVKLFKIS